MALRHPSVEQVSYWLKPNPNLLGHPGGIAQMCSEFADEILVELEDGPELTAGLRKLLEAKDCFVRQAILDQERTD
jgi:hypothetical protein